MQKPADGWLHNDTLLEQGEGVFYAVKYIGALQMRKSVQPMSFEQRTGVTREAITLCLEAAQVQAPRRRNVERYIQEAIQDEPEPKHLNIKLTISTTGIALIVIETGEILTQHIMPAISFATGGAPEEYHTIGYIAKDEAGVRECHVFDCGNAAKDVIATIAQAFELRFKSWKKKGNQAGGGSAPVPTSLPPAGGSEMYGDAAIYDEAGAPDDGDLYGGDANYGDATADTYGQDSYGDLPAGGESNYGDDAYGAVGESLYDEAAGERTYDSAANAMQDMSLYGGDESHYDQGNTTYDTAGN